MVHWLPCLFRHLPWLIDTPRIFFMISVIRVSLCSSRWPGTSHVAQARLQLVICMLLLLKRQKNIQPLLPRGFGTSHQPLPSQECSLKLLSIYSLFSLHLSSLPPETGSPSHQPNPPLCKSLDHFYLSTDAFLTSWGLHLPTLILRLRWFGQKMAPPQVLVPEPSVPGEGAGGGAVWEALEPLGGGA